MRKVYIPKTSSLFVDAIIFVIIASFIFAIAVFSARWESSFNPTYTIDLSIRSLPLYALFSGLRGFIAYVVSFIFTMFVGYSAAKSPRAEKMIIPFLDIMQSIPVLGFLPGLVLGLVSIFPHTNMGLELASILMIFTGQVWNMAFSFYSSLKSVPTDLQEAALMMKLTPMQRLKLLELPYSAMNLTWNSVMSMAGGWFFLSVCEAFTLGDKDYRLPGLGAYMAVAIEKNETKAIIAGIIAMFSVIIFFDTFLWRPALAWVHRFRLEETNESKPQSEPILEMLLRDSRIFRFGRLLFHSRKRFQMGETQVEVLLKKVFSFLTVEHSYFNKLRRVVTAILFILLGMLSAVAVLKLLALLATLLWSDWLNVIVNTSYTLMRVIGALILGTLWATPAAIWIAQSQQRLRWFQPVVQLMASFPAPMLYPLAISIFVYFNLNFEIGSMILMLLGVQWYILFNVLAGALRVPNELKLAMVLMKSSRWSVWRYLFLPSVFPSLVTGWVTAAGGAWNASFVSEIINFRGQTLQAHGLGASISIATAHGNFAHLAANLVVMVTVVILLNRFLWAKIYRLAQTRYRLDL